MYPHTNPSVSGYRAPPEFLLQAAGPPGVRGPPTSTVAARASTASTRANLCKALRGSRCGRDERELFWRRLGSSSLSGQQLISSSIPSPTKSWRSKSMNLKHSATSSMLSSPTLSPSEALKPSMMGQK
ncbi:hypothetical protein F7725_022053 [Dissostichus mawsoni]|uniref:Uncharacterized protein n=1 Tax=Dissostichus mawsoni TaxID=36200 RepID=A0A7J5ZCV3_DISMA|nr:hypothetical protein F7725_022053 [Dissostichus mawsoni]